MKQNAKQIFYLLSVLFVFVAPVQLFESYEKNIEASSDQQKTLEQILEKRQNYHNQVRGRDVKRLVHILIVPGHDDEVVGAQFNGLTEVELTRSLGKKLYDYLSQEEGFNVVLASNEYGYNPVFESYFNNEKESIQKFIETSKKNFLEKVTADDLVVLDTNFHNEATPEVAERLYGINRWVNNEDFDLVIHIHFNDYGGRKKNKVGKHSGFSIYTPGKLFQNYELSRALADSVFEEIQKIQSISNLKSEKEGAIEGHELIALGANESLKAGSILVEYGYIYEDKIFNTKKRDETFDDFAYATYLGIKKLMNEEVIKEREE